MFQITGNINEKLQPILSIELMNGAKFDCLLDTGFQGTLVVPRKFAQENSLIITGREAFLAAESSEIEFDTAIAEIKWKIAALQIAVLGRRHPDRKSVG